MIALMMHTLIHNALAACGAGEQKKKKKQTHPVRTVLKLGAGVALGAAVGRIVVPTILYALLDNALDQVHEIHEVDPSTGLVEAPEGTYWAARRSGADTVVMLVNDANGIVIGSFTLDEADFDTDGVTAESFMLVEDYLYEAAQHRYAREFVTAVNGEDVNYSMRGNRVTKRPATRTSATGTVLHGVDGGDAPADVEDDAVDDADGVWEEPGTKIEAFWNNDDDIVLANDDFDEDDTR